MIDFDALPTLIGPRFRRIIAERQDREKLARAHMKRARGPKNHSTNRERSREESARAAKVTRENAAKMEALRLYRDEVRRYWAGERDTHPGAF
jgi:hypothetical protein